MNTQDEFTDKERHELSVRGYDIVTSRRAERGKYHELHSRVITKPATYSVYPIELQYWTIEYDTEHDKYIGGRLTYANSAKEAINIETKVTY